MSPSTLWQPERIAQYRRLGWWSDDTYRDLMHRHAAIRPDAPMLSARRRIVSWSEAKRWTDAVAASLVRQGFPRDGVLATWLPNAVENYLLRVACEKAGILWLPVTRRARGRELRQILGTSRARGLVFTPSERRDVWSELQEVLPTLPALRFLCVAGGSGGLPATPLEEFAATAAKLREIDGLAERAYRPDEVAMLIPTSGSTGLPKLAQYLLGGAVARGRAQTDLFRIGPDDVIAATVQGFGPSITPLLAAPVAGAHVVVLDHATPDELLRTIKERRVSIVCAVPPTYRELLPLVSRKTSDVGSVRIWYSTGMGMPPDLARELEDTTGAAVLSGYGGVDLGCWTSPVPDDPREVRHFTVGRPRGGTELRLLREDEASAEGEVCGRGPSSTDGYFEDLQATNKAWSPDGWFRTGDVGRLDDAGNLVIVGRTVEVINRGGQKIHPGEIEQLLQAHPRVAEAAVVPFADERLGERVCAYVVPRDGVALTLDEVVRFLRDQRVASYKLPERLELVSSLPTSSGGKLSREALRQDLARRLQASAV